MDKKSLNRYLVKYRIIGDPGREFWTDLMIFDVHKKNLKEILEKALHQAKDDATFKLKKSLKVEDISVISFSLIDSE